MKKMLPLLAIVLLAACSSPTDEEASPSQTATAPATIPTTTPAPQPTSASATGTVQAVNPEAGSITIAHGPVPELDWPGMTMTFQAPLVDLSAVKAGDRISFDFVSTGMAAEVTSIELESASRPRH